MWAHVFLGTDELIGLDEAIARSGVPRTDAETAVRLLGIPVSDQTRIAEHDTAILGISEQLSSIFGEDVSRQILRTVGSAAARIAETLTMNVRIGVETPMMRETDYADFVRLVGPLFVERFPRLMNVIDRVTRYHMLSMNTQTWGTDVDVSAVTMTRSVGFADMVGFTTHAAAVSTSELTRMIDVFEARVSDEIGRHGGRAVKFIGDEVFFAFVDADAACACALDLLTLARDETIPDVRVGMAHGEVVARAGDYYGPVVNLASRLVNVADSGTAIVSTGLAQHATAHDFEPQPARELKGVAEPVAIMRLTS